MESSTEETDSDLTTQSETTDSETESEIDSIPEETFEVFFTDQKLKEQAKDFLSESQDKSIILFLLPTDILKKIIFDYLINTKSTEEQEIYRDFKNLALTCKLFSKLGEVIMQQIVLISDKEVEDYSKKISSSPKIHFAALTNKALWLIHKKETLEYYDDYIKSEKVIYFKDVQSNAWWSLTPIELATAKNNYAVAKVILSLGVKIEPRKYYMTGESDGTWTGPLHKACENCNLKMVVLLIENGANVNALDPNGISPIYKVLQKFCSSGIFISDLEIEDRLVKILEILIKKGAKFNHIDTKKLNYITNNELHSPKAINSWKKILNLLKRLS